MQNTPTCAMCGKTDHSEGQTHPFTPQGTTERFEEMWRMHGRIDLAKKDVLAFIESETSLSYQRGQEEALREVLNINLAPEDADHVMLKSMNNGYMGFGYGQAWIMTKVDALLKAKESNQK